MVCYGVQAAYTDPGLVSAAILGRSIQSPEIISLILVFKALQLRGMLCNGVQAAYTNPGLVSAAI